MTKISNKFIIFSLIAVFSCTFEPKYQKPTSPIAQDKIKNVDLIKNDDSSNVFNKEDNSPIKDILWRDFFSNKNLQKVIEIALENNRNLKIAALNIEAARSYYGISRSALFPAISANNSLTRSKSSNSDQIANSFNSNLAITSFEIDFFGKFRNIKKASLQNFLATKQAHDIIQITLIAQAADAYLEFLLNHQNMLIAQEILEVNQQQFLIIKMRYESGIDPKVRYLDQKNKLNQAKIDLANYQQIVSKNKNILKFLLGNSDKQVFNYEEIDLIDEVQFDEKLLSFIPSIKLLQRPDIQQAEFNLKAANANIGAARAAFFPSIMITGSAGYSSSKLDDLFSNPLSWSYTPKISLPIFSGLSNWSNLNLSHIRKKIEIVKYEQTIERAFKELLDYLAVKKSTQAQLELSQEIFDLQSEIYQISLSRYNLGNESKFNNLNQNIIFLKAKQQYLEAKKNHLSSLINIYKALGGDVISNSNIRI